MTDPAWLCAILPAGSGCIGVQARPPAAVPGRVPAIPAIDQPARPAGQRLPYLAGLDGLRALAVVAVLLYHADVRWAGGGFLGVEVFFVLSGYLITGLLLAEWGEGRGLNLAQFWRRRARRLLPALYVLLVVVLAYAALFLPRDLARLRGEAVAAFGYVANWYLVFSERSYFEIIGRPSPLLHLWSLAIEAQFYVLWPPLLIFALRRWSPRQIAPVVVAAALCSSLLMMLLYSPERDPSAIYYRTDTRLGGLLIGAALALVWSPWARRERAATTPRVWYEVAGLGALAALMLSCLLFTASAPLLYRGGFLVVAVLTAIAIAVLVAPQGRYVAALLDVAVLRWLGTRSYSLYLWHWPIFVITRPRIDVAMSGVPVLVLRLVLAGLLAECSYRAIEQPVRRGALARGWRKLRAMRGMVGLVWRTYLTAAALLLVLLGVTVALATAPPPALPRSVVIDGPEQPDEPTASESPASEPAGSAEPAAALNVPALPPTEVPVAQPPPPPPTRAFKPASRVTAVGDSVMVSVAGPLDQGIKGRLYLDAAVGRLPTEGIAILAALRDQGRLGQVVIVHLGNNGLFADGEVAEMMSILADVRLVIIVNVRVPRPWEGENNRQLAEARHAPNAVLVEWYGLTNDHPEYFGDDGVHPNGIGQELYVRMVAKWANEPLFPASQGVTASVGQRCVGVGPVGGRCALLPSPRWHGERGRLPAGDLRAHAPSVWYGPGRLAAPT